MLVWRTLQKRGYRWLTCLFILAMFADAANIPDIFTGPSIIVDHDDEDAPVQVHHSESSLSFHSLPSIITDTVTIKAAPRVMYDVDSPSLDVRETPTVVVAAALPPEETNDVQSYVVVEELYLRNSTFLI